MKKSSDIRKGFKFTKNVVASTTKENVAFEDLREDVSSPATKKRKPVLAADEDIQIDEKSHKNRNRDEIDNITVHSPTKVNTSMSPPQRVSSTSARKSSRSSRSPPQDAVRQTVTSETVLVLETGNISAKTRTETTKSDSQISHTSKAYYPKINYDPSQSEVIASILSSNLTHKDILLKVVADICHIESLGLKSYSDENKGRESLIFALQEILRTLPDEISVATADTIVFSPELSTDEKIEVESLERAVTALKQQSIALERYENNISELGKKYGLWIDGIPKSATTTVSTSIPSGQSLDVLGMAQQYDQILNDLQKNCGKLINLSEGLDNVKTEARLAQTALYDTAQAVRIKGNPAKISGDPKEIIRNYLAL